MTKPPSFIESFVEYASDFPSPELFKKWAAISCLSGAVERRVWSITRNTPLIPNFIILLVSPPGIGKTRIITEVHELWAESGAFNVAPTSVTRAALIDQLADKKIIRTLKDASGRLTGELFEYHSILVSAPEFGVFVPKHDLEFLNTINDLYDCRRNFIERRRSLKTVIEINRPHISIIAGTQPSYLGELLPDAAYGMGFTSRCIMVYQGTGPDVPIFQNMSNASVKQSQRKALAAQLKRISDTYGQMVWEVEVQTALQSWVSSGMAPIPEHARLTNYNTRRDLHLLKLCMIAAIAENTMKIDLSHFHWARDTLLEVEELMPDVFKDMIAGPDTQIIAELHQYCRAFHAKEKGKKISQSRIFHYLSTRVPSNRVLDIVNLMVKSDLLEEFIMPNGTRMYSPKTPEAL